jgi:hypothetical protein
MTEEFDLPSYHRGIRLFNEGRFFDAHEVLEDVWRAAPAQEKKFLQGLIQLAVAFHHYSTGNTVGACSVMKRAARNLSGYPERYLGVELSPLLQAISHCAAALASGFPLPSLPRIEHPEC